MRGMKSSIVLLVVIAATSLGAQQEPAAPAAALTDTVISLDRIVAVVGVQPITQYDVQERMLQELLRWTGLHVEDVGVGVDGCGVATFALPDHLWLKGETARWPSHRHRPALPPDRPPRP